MLRERSGLSTRSIAPVMFAAWRSVNRISVGLTNRTDPTEMSSTRSRDWLLNPTPRTDTTVPAGNHPSPGMTSEIATLPPTVTVPGSTLARTILPFQFHSDVGSNPNDVRLPAAASWRMRNATVITGYSPVTGSVVTYEIATRFPSTTAAPASSPVAANIPMPTAPSKNAAS